jgi:hypothetical protein
MTPLVLVALVGLGAADVLTPEVPRAVPRDDPGLLERVADRQDGVLVLADGMAVPGRVVVVGGDRVSLRDASGRVRQFRVAAVRGLVRDVVPHGTLPARESIVRVVLRDASVVGGRLVERTASGVVVESPASGRRELAAADVSAVIPVREEPRTIDLAPRHVAAPSAFLLRRGEALVAVANVVDLSASVGVREWLAVSAGTVLPALHAWAYGSNAYASARAGYVVRDWIRVAVGLHGTVGDGGRAAGYLSGTVTLGPRAAHLTLHAGPTFGGASRLAELGDVGVALCGTVELPRGFAITSETWASRAFGRTDTLSALAGRYRLWRGAVDAGAVWSARRGELLPWLGLALDVTR